MPEKTIKRRLQTHVWADDHIPEPNHARRRNRFPSPLRAVWTRFRATGRRHRLAGRLRGGSANRVSPSDG
jgi:hypothetical protein